MAKLARPQQGTRTHIYLFPYIKYNFGHNFAEIFHAVRPVNSYLAYASLQEEVNVPNIYVEFDQPIVFAINKIMEHPMYVSHETTNGRTIVKFNIDDERIYNKFLQSKYSEMYTNFLDRNRQYFEYENCGILTRTYMYEICKKTKGRTNYTAKVLKVSADQLTELDSKLDIKEELIN